MSTTRFGADAAAVAAEALDTTGSISDGSEPEEPEFDFNPPWLQGNAASQGRTSRGPTARGRAAVNRTLPYLQGNAASRGRTAPSRGRTARGRSGVNRTRAQPKPTGVANAPAAAADSEFSTFWNEFLQAGRQADQQRVDAQEAARQKAEESLPPELAALRPNPALRAFFSPSPSAPSDGPAAADIVCGAAEAAAAAASAPAAAEAADEAAAAAEAPAAAEAVAETAGKAAAN